MRSHFVFRAFLALGVATFGITLAAPAAQAANAVAWISGVGDDANPCTRTAPCKTWNGAIAKTDEGGFIGVLDPGNFANPGGGTVTVDKSITLDASGYVTTINVSGGVDGLVVNAPAGSHVVLRNFNIHAAYAAGACGGGSGVNVQNVGTLKLDGISISGFQNAVTMPLTGAAAGASVLLDHVSASDDCVAGIKAVPDAGKSASVFVDAATVSSSGTGLSAGAGAEVWVKNSLVTGNATGVTPGSGVIHSVCNNTVAGNGVNGVFTDDLCGGAPTSTPVLFCTVPKVLKKTEAQATAALKAASCGVGRVVKKKSSKKNKGKVIAQTVAAGVLVKAGQPVGLVIGK